MSLEEYKRDCIKTAKIEGLTSIKANFKKAYEEGISASELVSKILVIKSSNIQKVKERLSTSEFKNTIKKSIYSVLQKGISDLKSLGVSKLKYNKINSIGVQSKSKQRGKPHSFNLFTIAVDVPEKISQKLWDVAKEENWKYAEYMKPILTLKENDGVMIAPPKGKGEWNSTIIFQGDSNIPIPKEVFKDIRLSPDEEDEVEDFIKSKLINTQIPNPIK